MVDAVAKAKADALKQQGNAAVAAKKFGKAKDFYTDALKLDSTNHTIYSNRSGVYMDLGDAVAAEKDARSAIEHAPEWAKGFYRLGVALESQGRHDEAARAFNDACGYDPTNADLIACKERATKAAEAEIDPSAPGRNDSRPSLADALKVARTMADPASLPRVGRLGDLVTQRHSSTLKLGCDAKRGRHLLAARAIKPFEVIATEHAMFWAPPRCNQWAMTAPALAEVGPDLKSAPAGALEAWALQLTPFYNAAVERAGGSFAGRPEAELPPISKGELLLRVLQQNSHGIPWSEGHPGELCCFRLHPGVKSGSVAY